MWLGCETREISEGLPIICINGILVVIIAKLKGELCGRVGKPVWRGFCLSEHFLIWLHLR